MTNEQLAEIKARANAATAGPWTQMNGVNIFTDLGATNKNGVTADRNDGWCIADTSEGLTFVDGELVEMESNEQWDNAKFIAHARQDIPNLIAEVERLQGALDYKRGLIGWYRHKAEQFAEKTERLQAKLSTYESLAQENDYYAILDEMSERNASEEI